MEKKVFLVTILVLLILGAGTTAKADYGTKNVISKEERQVLEEEYVEEVRRILLEKGCRDAGVTLTYTTDMEGNIEYTVSLYHEKINRMKSRDILLLQARIKEAAIEKYLGEVSLKQIRL